MNTVGIVTGLPGGTYNRMGADLAALLDDPLKPFRIEVMNSSGSIRNLDELLNTPGVDVAIVQGDVLEAFRDNPQDYARLKREMRFVAPLHQEQVHILARDGIQTLRDLDGHRVNIGASGSGSQITARNLFARLGVVPKIDESATPQAREKLLRGEIDALVYVVGKPASLFKEISGQDVQGSNLHFISIAAAVPGLESYLDAQLSADDYPNLIFKDHPVRTVGVQSVMAVYAFDATNKKRYVPLMDFVNRFFSRSGELVRGNYNQNWCQVDLSSGAPGWTRFDAAQAWLDSHKVDEVRLCAVAGATCQACPRPPLSVSTAPPLLPLTRTTCEAAALKGLTEQGVQITDPSLPAARTLLNAWKSAHPAECR